MNSQDIIYIHAIKVRTVIGILPHERAMKQTLIIDCELGTDTRAAGKSDDIADALNYAAICDSKASYAQSKIPFLLLRLGRVHEAALWLHTFLGKHPDSVSLRLLYANILMGQRKTDAALQQYRRILASHPDDPAVTLPLAEIYMAAGRTAEAWSRSWAGMRIPIRPSSSWRAFCGVRRISRPAGPISPGRSNSTGRRMCRPKSPSC